jgi:hypothetical protein
MLQDLYQCSSTGLLTLIEVGNYSGVRRFTSGSNPSIKLHQLMDWYKPAGVSLQGLVDMALQDSTLAIFL